MTMQGQQDGNPAVANSIDTHSTQRPLRDLRVLQIGSGFAAALAGMVLTDFGSDTVKVEPPEGDPDRRQRAFGMLNRGKVSYTADLGQAEDRKKVTGLCEAADVVIVSLPVKTAAKYGMDYASLKDARPDIVYCSITGFGPTGPYADYPPYEQLVTLKIGRGSFYLGQAQRTGPIFPAVPVAGFGAAMGALQGIFAALHDRLRTGQGHLVETSLLQGLSAYDMGAWQAAQKDPNYQQLTNWDGRGRQRGAALGYIFGATRDGHWLQFTQLASHLYYRFMGALGLESMFLEERFIGLPNVAPDAGVDAWHRIMARLREKTLDEWMEIFGPNDDITAEPIRTPAWAAEHPQVKHNHDFIEVVDDRYGKVKHLGPLFTATATPAAPRTNAPDLGAGNKTLTWAPRRPTRVSGDLAAQSGRGPLADITVVEMASYYAAPFGTTLLADLGARVIKVAALSPDQPMGDGPQKTSQGKEVIAVNIKEPRGLEIVHRLVANADVFMHNFRSGVVKRLGIDYETLSKLNPSLIYLNAVAYGVDGPNAKKPAYDPMPGAVAGSAWRQGGGYLPPDPAATQNLSFEDLLEASRSGGLANWGFSDPASALGVGSALTAGIFLRDLTGKGQELITTMLRSNLHLNAEEMLIVHGVTSDLPRVDREFMGTGPAYRLYQAGSDSWVFLGCGDDGDWHNFTAHAGEARLQADRFSTAEGRYRNATELEQILTEVFLRRPADAWEALLARQSLPCIKADGPSFGEFAMKDRHVLENRFAVEIEDASGRYVRHSAIVHIDGAPDYLRGSGMHGEATSRVLREDLGFSQGDVAALARDMVVYLRELGEPPGSSPQEARTRGS